MWKNLVKLLHYASLVGLAGGIAVSLVLADTIDATLRLSAYVALAFAMMVAFRKPSHFAAAATVIAGVRMSHRVEA